MGPAVCMCLCVLSISCVQSQIVLTQSGPEVKKPGESVRLECEGSGFDTSGTWMNWIRQARGKGLEWLVQYLNPSSKYYNSAIQGRFTASKSGSKLYLQMDALRAEDSGVYYCARDPGGYGYFDYWGPGTSVTVTAAQSSKPSVFPLVSFCRNKSDANVHIGCLATGFLPQPVVVTWNAGSSAASGAKTFPAILSPNNGLYSQSSQLSVPASEWESKTYQCLVKHTPTSSEQTVTLKKAENKSLKPSENPASMPQIQLLTDVSCNKNPKENFVCFGTELPNVSNITVKWLLDGKLTASSIPNRKTPFELYERKQFRSNDWKNSVECMLTIPGMGNYSSKVSNCTEGKKRTRRGIPTIGNTP